MDKILIPLEEIDVPRTGLNQIQKKVADLLPEYTRRPKLTYSGLSCHSAHLNVLYKGVEKFEGKFVLVAFFNYPSTA